MLVKGSKLTMLGLTGEVNVFNDDATTTSKTTASFTETLMMIRRVCDDDDKPNVSEWWQSGKVSF